MRKIRTQLQQRVAAAEVGAVWTFCTQNGERRQGMIVGFEGPEVLVELHLFGIVYLCRMSALVLRDSTTWPVRRWSC